jgi:hypothetical protein
MRHAKVPAEPLAISTPAARTIAMTAMRIMILAMETCPEAGIGVPLELINQHPYAQTATHSSG